MNVIVANKNSGLLGSLEVDVIKSINGEFTVEEIINTFANFFFNRMFLDITAIKDYMDTANIQKLSMNMDVNKIIFLLDNELMNNRGYISKLISIGIYNFGNTKESLMYLYNHPNTYKDVAGMHDLSSQVEVEAVQERRGLFSGLNNMNRQQVEVEKPTRVSRIIGFKNATPSAGATTLIYMLKKLLSKKDYVVALEVNKNDFGFFNEKDMYSVNYNNLDAATDKFGNASIILIDLNNTEYELCDEVIYLIEPSTIKLNKMMLLNKNIFDKMYGHKIVLNKSLLTPKDITDFEYEAHSKIDFNIPPLNDRLDNIEVLEEFINVVGIKGTKI